MLNNINNILDKFEIGFSIGKGGIGDCLFLLSSIYKNQGNLKTNIVFFADNESNIREFLNCFKSENHIQKIIVYQGIPNIYVYGACINHKYFKYKAHIPDSLNYVEEWDKNWKKYRNELPDKCEIFYDLFVPEKTNKKTNKKIIGIGCFGSRKESFKKKWLNENEFNILLETIINKNEYDEIYIFGNENDKEFKINIINKKIIDLRGISLKECFYKINSCSKIISTDTWYKSWSHFVNIETNVIKTQYIFNGIENKEFYDPGNNIFLKDWGFDIYTFNDIIEKIKNG
jgi:hypothetical protein